MTTSNKKTIILSIIFAVLVIALATTLIITIVRSNHSSTSAAEVPAGEEVTAVVDNQNVVTPAEQPAEPEKIYTRLYSVKFSVEDEPASNNVSVYRTYTFNDVLKHNLSEDGTLVIKTYADGVMKFTGVFDVSVDETNAKEVDTADFAIKFSDVESVKITASYIDEDEQLYYDLEVKYYDEDLNEVTVVLEKVQPIEAE